MVLVFANKKWELLVFPNGCIACPRCRWWKYQECLHNVFAPHRSLKKTKDCQWQTWQTLANQVANQVPFFGPLVCTFGEHCYNVWKLQNATTERVLDTFGQFENVGIMLPALPRTNLNRSSQEQKRFWHVLTCWQPTDWQSKCEGCSVDFCCIKYWLHLDLLHSLCHLLWLIHWS